MISLTRNKLIWLFGALALTGVLAFAACGGDDEDAPAPAQQPATATEAEAPAAAEPEAPAAAEAEAPAAAEPEAPAAAEPEAPAAAEPEAMAADNVNPYPQGDLPGAATAWFPENIGDVPVPVLYDSESDYPAATGDTIVIGQVIPLSGTLKQVGDAHRQGLEAAQAILGPIEINGTYHPVEFVFKEAAANDWDPQLAAAACTELVTANNVVAITGLGGGEGEGCAGVADRLGVPIVGVNMVTDGVVSDNCSKWFVGYSPAPSTLGPSWNVAIQQSIGPENVATPWYVIGDAPDWGRATANAWFATTGVETGGQDFAPGGTTDWQPFIEKMQDSGLVGAIAAISWGTQYNAFIQQAGESGASEQMILSHPVGVPEFVVNAPGLAEYLTTWRNLGQWGGIWSFEDEWDTSRSAGVNILRELNEKHFEMFGTPPAGQGVQQAGGYFMLWQAIDRADSTDPEAVINELVGDFFWTPHWDRPVNVDTPGRQVSVPFGLTQVVQLANPPYGDEFAHDLVAWVAPEELLGAENAPARGVLDVCDVGGPSSTPNGGANQASRVN